MYLDFSLLYENGQPFLNFNVGGIIFQRCFRQTYFDCTTRKRHLQLRIGTTIAFIPVLNAHRTRRRCTGGYLGPMPSTPPSLPATRQTSVPKRTSTTFYSSGWRARKTTRCGHALFQVFFTRQYVYMITLQIDRNQRRLHVCTYGKESMGVYALHKYMSKWRHLDA